MRVLAFLLLILWSATAQAETDAPERGRVIEGAVMQSAILRRAVGYDLYLPPGFDHDSRRYPLIVLLHGYGSHEGDLFGLSPRLPLGASVASLRAPLEENGGNAWFKLMDGERGIPQAGIPGGATLVFVTDILGVN